MNATYEHARTPSSGPEVEHSRMTVQLQALADDGIRVQDSVMSSIDALFATYKCRAVYLDVGTNRGVQIRKLYQPLLFPNASALQQFATEFRGIDRCDVCTIGFEPNPRQWPHLQHMQGALRAAGAGVLIFPSAAGIATGSQLLTVPRADRQDPWGDLGASVSPHAAGLEQKGQRWNTTLPTSMISLCDVVHRVRHWVPAHARILMKLDVEGSEYMLVPSLIMCHAWCQVTRAFVEWHTKDFNRAAALRRARSNPDLAPHRQQTSAESGFRWSQALEALLKQAISNMSSAVGRTCGPVIETLDDESYMFARPTLPARGGLCRR